MNLLLFLFLNLSVYAADKIQVQDIQCFTEADTAQKVFQIFQHEYDQLKRIHHRQMRVPEFGIEYVTDATDKFGRKHCLISRSKNFGEQHLKIISSHQRTEDDARAKKEISSLKDPWGGKAVDLSGKPKIMRACQGEQSLNCDDLIITAMMGEEDVIEYRFWLGARSGDGLVVHKSTRNALELSKIMNQLKKDKENLSYSFSPKDQSAFVKDASIGGN